MAGFERRALRNSHMSLQQLSLSIGVLPLLIEVATGFASLIVSQILLNMVYWGRRYSQMKSDDCFVHRHMNGHK